MQLGAALTGDLAKMMEEEIDRGSTAVRAATSQTLDWLKTALRQQVLDAFGSQRLANTWRGKFYPNKGLDAAGVVYSNAPHIIEAFSEATVITAHDGFWLAIPSPDCPRGPRGARLTPSTFPEDRFGPLHFVYRPGKASLLVVDKLRRHTGKRKGYSKASAKAIREGRAETVVMFFLVPRVQLSKRVDPQGAYGEAVDRLVDNVIREWNADGRAQG
ncbi:MAG: hypothetical protein BGO82_17190 [Devosia sp. 67-54]|nr:MAG: hypothetical protein BGO82_17190 [Devosia sp. 67-54]